MRRLSLPRPPAIALRLQQLKLTSTISRLSSPDFSPFCFRTKATSSSTVSVAQADYPASSAGGGPRAPIPRPPGWESVVGLEIHAQINSNSKLFSCAPVEYGGGTNSHVSLFDAAIPGTLPVLNKRCVEAGVLTALTLSCRLNPVSYFDRKHYFYADLPAGYQITQQRKAIANDGSLKFVVYSPGVHKKPYYTTARIHQLQLEQDSGKSLHDNEEQRSLIDLNRAGIGLMEIVFEPDLKDGEEAGALVKELSWILLQLGTCDCKMEEGGLRVDANVSVNRVGEPLGTRTEIKNVGSIRALVNSIEFEVIRQINILEGGGEIVNETRSYDAETKTTLQMRDKEVKQDYRFMPEPNLPPLRLNYSPDLESSSAYGVNIYHLRKRLVELPETIRTRLVNTYHLRLDMAIIIMNWPGMFDYFNAVMKFLPATSGQQVANLLQVQIIEMLNANDLTFNELKLEPKTFVEIFKLVDNKIISLDKVNLIVNLILEGDSRGPREIVEVHGWTSVKDEDEIKCIVDKVISENSKVVKKYSETKDTKHLNTLMGKIRKATDVNYDMAKVAEYLEKTLNK